MTIIIIIIMMMMIIIIIIIITIIMSIDPCVHKNLSMVQHTPKRRFVSSPSGYARFTQ